MPNQIRTYYKNQTELSIALREIIDIYFENKITETELEKKVIEIISANEDKFYKDGKDQVAYKPAQILGKARLEILQKVLDEEGK